MGQALFYNFGYFICTAKLITFCHYNYIYKLFSFLFFYQGVNHMFNVVFAFGYQYAFCTGGNTTMQGNITRISAHNFYNKQAVMRIGSIPDLINSFNGGIYCCIKTYGKIGANNIFIYCACNTNTRNIMLFRKQSSTFKRSVTTNNNKAFYAAFF